MPAARGAGAEFARRRAPAEAENREGGGAPGGAARPKQAVRASGSFCGARHARSVGGWQHPSAWRGPRPRRLPALHSEREWLSCEWLFVNLALAKLGRAGVARMEEHVRHV